MFKEKNFFNFFKKNEEIINKESLKENFTIDQVREKVKIAIEALPEEIKEKMDKGDLIGMCGTITTNILCRLDSKVPIKGAISSDKNSNGHTYLVANCEEEKDCVIDATIGQFVEGFEGPFFGTRQELKDLIFSPNTVLINTRSSNNPSEAFQRIWGDSSAGMI